MSRPLAAITGASSGIGAVFARRLAPDYDLLLVARRKDRLQALAAELTGASGTRIDIMAADLTDGQQLAEVAQRLVQEPNLELFINNAGFGLRGPFWATSIAEQRRMHELNVMAVLELSHAALGGMVSRRSGAIINVASVAGFVRRAGSVSYGSTKAWVLAFTEALHLDLQRAGSPVQVQALCPGFTYTEFHDVMKEDRSRLASKALWLDARFVVDASLDGLARHRLFVIPGWRYRLVVNLISILPGPVRLGFETLSARKRP